MNQRQRPNFRCWQCCKRSFHQTLEIGDASELLVEYPFCGALTKVDLAPCRNISTTDHPAAPDLPNATSTGTSAHPWSSPGWR